MSGLHDCCFHAQPLEWRQQLPGSGRFSAVEMLSQHKEINMVIHVQTVSKRFLIAIVVATILVSSSAFAGRATGRPAGGKSDALVTQPATVPDAKASLPKQSIGDRIAKLEAEVRVLRTCLGTMGTRQISVCSL